MATYKPLQSIVLTSAASSVTFSGIDQSYTDLRLVINYGITSGNASAILQFNNDTTSAYSNTLIWAVTSGTTGGRNTSQTGIYLLQTIGQGSGQTFFAPSTIEINNYSNTTLNKTILSRSNGINNSSTYEVNANVGLWRNTAAITSITIVSQSSTFVAGSTFDLYGIKSGAPQALGGDLVTTDGNYWYHTFNSTQTFTPLKALSVDYLVVAGGGGGGRDIGGGGGGGGFRTSIGSSTLSLGVQAYTVTVGAGGARGASNVGNNGGNSTFATITSAGGGGGGSSNILANKGLDGGSGGGGGTYNPGSGWINNGIGLGNTPSTSPSQGNNGGTGGGIAAGGGGGAGAVGGNSNSGSNIGGTGGNGASSSLSGSSVTYAGGGGGAGNSGGTISGGTGGGGSGGSSGDPSSGTDGSSNLGGGGGGARGGAGVAGNGGSGIVIVRYAV